MGGEFIFYLKDKNRLDIETYKKTIKNFIKENSKNNIKNLILDINDKYPISYSDEKYSFKLPYDIENYDIISKLHTNIIMSVETILSRLFLELCDKFPYAFYYEHDLAYAAYIKRDGDIKIVDHYGF